MLPSIMVTQYVLLVSVLFKTQLYKPSEVTYSTVSKAMVLQFLESYPLLECGFYGFL